MAVRGLNARLTAGAWRHVRPDRDVEWTGSDHGHGSRCARDVSNGAKEVMQSNGQQGIARGPARISMTGRSGTSRKNRFSNYQSLKELPVA